MKKLMVTFIIVLIIAGVFIFSSNKVWNKNADELGKTINGLTEENNSISLKELTSFEWDTMYSFEPYTSKETIYDVVGYKWDKISETVSEGMNQVIFIDDGEVVCYIYGYSNNLGYYFDIPKNGDESYGEVSSSDSKVSLKIDHVGKEEVRVLSK
ncbi:MAG: hypothetical protein RR620_07975 [Clostridium sp.]